MKTAFTMIELVFIIVVLGILAAVAFPKLGPAIGDAKISKGRTTVSSIRSAIANARQQNMLKGSAQYPQILDDASTAVGQELFDGNATVSILQYPIYSKASGGHWMKRSVNGAVTQYRFYISGTEFVDFNYTRATGTFDCNHNNDNCKQLTE